MRPAKPVPDIVAAAGTAAGPVAAPCAAGCTCAAEIAVLNGKIDALKADFDKQMADAKVASDKAVADIKQSINDSKKQDAAKGSSFNQDTATADRVASVDSSNSLFMGISVLGGLLLLALGFFLGRRRRTTVVAP